MWKKLAVLGLLTVFIIHFAFTGLYNAPLNPLKAKHSNIIAGYMNPLFSQNWKLFAPNPASDNNTFYVRAQVKKEDGVKTTDWIDLTSYMIERNQTNRFTPYNRLVRIQRGAVTAMVEEDDLIVTLHRKAQSNEEAKKKLDDLHDDKRKSEQQEYGEKLLNRYAQAYLNSLHPEWEVTKTQLMLVETKAVPFSEKEKKEVETKTKVYQFDWRNYQPVAPIF
ncbi:DUF5819 family protein [Desmospora profundinema]|uniref:Uncharacterized protein n=1 Tax=Desmospora profundinema TaxID=1571184 RepID=A0ABU1IMW7_9BACL|nr:DUF5819 family protein [Desmospora profundinema]MDR6225753.1 hypothetical protein [Desmospora profundinema]